MLTSKKNLTAKQKIERANVALLSNPHTMAYAGVIMVGKYEVRSDCPTAMTDGLNVIYGDTFVHSLPEPEIRGLVMHETLHKTFQHTFLWRRLFERDARMANVAIDFIVNLVVHDISVQSGGFVKLPPGGCLDEKFRGWDAGQVFNYLMQNASQAPQGGLDEHDWEGAKEYSASEVQKIAQDIDQAIRQGQMLAGKNRGNVSKVLGELTVPEENWREQMTDFLTAFKDQGSISTWRKPSRRWLHQDIYMPSTIDEAMGKLLIGVDLSGSIGQEELNQFLSHVQLMCTTLHPERVDLLYWDTEVTVHEVYFPDSMDKLAKSTRPVGGGGTNVECVPAYIEENKLTPDACVILTDGYLGGSWGRWKQPVLWGIVGNVDAMPTVGKVVRIK